MLRMQEIASFEHEIQKVLGGGPPDPPSGKGLRPLPHLPPARPFGARARTMAGQKGPLLMSCIPF